MVRCSKSSTSGRAFGADGKSRVFPTGHTGWEFEYGYTVKLAVKEDHSSTLPLRSDDAGRGNDRIVLPLGGGIAIGRPAGVSFASPRCVRSSW